MSDAWDEAAWNQCVAAGDWKTFTTRFAIADTTTACEDQGADEVASMADDVFDELYADFTRTFREKLGRLQASSGMTPDAFDEALREQYRASMDATVAKLAG